MKKILSVLLAVFMLVQMFCVTSFAEGAVYDYSSFCGEWHKVDPDELWGDIILDIIEVKDNNNIRFCLDGGDIQEQSIYNNQVTWSEHWDDGPMNLTLTFHDDHIYLKYSRVSHEWYPDITFVSSTVKPKRINNECSVTLNGNRIEFDQPPVIVNGRTLVPVRALIEAMGGTVGWDASTSTVTLSLNSDVIKLTIGSTTAYLNNEMKTLDVPPQIIGDRTLMPVRFISEGFNFNVDWDASSRSVLITTKETSSKISNEEALQKLSVFYNQYSDMYVETQCNGYASIREDADIQQINTHPAQHYFFDIDSDGIDELIIYGEPTNTENLVAIGHVYSIWKVHNNEIIPVVSKIGHNGRNGKHYSTVMFDNQIMILESAGFSNSSGYFGEYILYKVENNVPVVKYVLNWDSNGKSFINGSEITFEDSQTEKEELLNAISILTKNN